MLKQSLGLLKLAQKHSGNVYKYIAIIVTLELVEIAGLYQLNTVRGDLYQAIQDYKPAIIWHSIMMFCIYAGGLVITGGYLGFLTNRLSFYIRTGLTKFYLKQVPNISNVGQRIQEDLSKFGEYSTDFWLIILRSSLKLPLFITVVIGLTKWYVGLAVLGAVIGGTYLTKIVAARLVDLQSQQETNEANFRNNLVLSEFTVITALFHTINDRLKLLSFTQSGLRQAFILLPFIILMPLYIAGTLAMGDFFRTVDALGQVIGSLTVVVDNRQLLVNIQTTLSRVKKLEESERVKGLI